MRKKINLMLVFALFLTLLLLGMVNALSSGYYSGTGFSNAQYNAPSFNEFYPVGGGPSAQELWPLLGDKDNCLAREDFMLNIRPGGCSPAVVRSDLLEERDVPVFCQIDAIQINPLIDVSWIKGVTFQKKSFPDGVGGVSFHPSRYALKIYNPVLSEKLMNNIGYVVVVLKRQENEDEMPSEIIMNMTGIIRYDADKAFGQGRYEFYVSAISNNDWANGEYKKYGFWNGVGYVKVEDIEDNRARISLYRDINQSLGTFSIEKGKESNEIYFPGYYCRVAIRVKLEDIVAPAKIVRLRVGENDYWLKEGDSFLDGKCRVNKIDITDMGSKVLFYCGNQKVLLSLGTANIAKIGSDETEQEVYETGEKLGVSKVEEKEKGVYLAYAGQMPKYVTKEGEEESSEDRQYVVVARGAEKNIDETTGRIRSEKLIKISEDVASLSGFNKDYTSKVKQIVKSALGIDAKDVEFVVFGKTEKNKDSTDGDNVIDFLGDKKFLGTAGSIDKSFEDKVYGSEGEVLEDYFSETVKAANEIANVYGAESDGTVNYGEIALFQAAQLAGELGKQKSEKELLEKFIENYPNSIYRTQAESMLQDLSVYDYRNAVEFVSVGRETIETRLMEAKKPSVQEANADFFINGKSVRIGIEEFYDIEDDTNNLQTVVQLKDITKDSVEIAYSYLNSNQERVNSNFKMKIGDKPKDIEIKYGTNMNYKFNVELRNINIEKIARISVIPRIPNTQTETNFTFRIGIEKRAIKLSDEKTLEMITNLNESIARWDKIVSNLGNVIKGLKTTCLATSAVLLVKNFFENMEGGAMARKTVMQKYYAECKTESTGDKNAFNACLNRKNTEIESDVDSYKNNVESVNENVKAIQNSNKNDLGGVNVDKATEDYRAEMKSKYKGKIISVVERDINGNKVRDKETDNYVVKDVLIDDALIDSASFTELRDLELGMLNSKSGGKTGEIGNEAVDSSLYTLNSRRAITINNEKQEESFGKDILFEEENYQGSKYELRSYKGQTWSDFKKASDVNYAVSDLEGIKDSQPMQAVSVNGHNYVVALDKTGNTYVPNNNWYKVTPEGVDGKKRTLTKLNPENDAERDELKSLRNIVFKRQDSSSLVNPWSQNLAKISFHETGEYKGLPAIVPLGKKWGIERGWYAGTKPYGAFSSGTAAYTESGIPKNFYVCNIGENRIEEFESSIGDDRCQLINLYSTRPSRILGLSESETTELINTAEKALYDSAVQYRKGNKKINVLGIPFDVGAPSIGVGTRCQDFMSPQDCLILFNVCDPVICPPSRCDLGGTYPVSNVVQSGVVGSIFLCLPNAKEGVMIPVCLTGIHAGLDGFVSILKSERDCLQESLNTGKQIGICDEITSIYMCEFFWRQAVPLAKVGIPNVIEAIAGQGTRGGGEYLTMEEAWSNAEDTVDFMKNEYGTTAFKAFQSRGTEDIGSEVCKGFVSARYPKLSVLAEPESPVQFTAWYDEIPYTEATVPPTSQYKVYYHIYAGNDQGAYYSVYLKSPPELGYYQSNPYITITTGYVEKGKIIDETKDFQAPAGYKELCVRINGEDECGFKQVTTSFAVDYMTDKYLEQQTANEVKSEEECISGEMSVMPTLHNPQESVAEGVQPAIYKRGVIRICSTDNPGKSVDGNARDESGRYKSVGYCSSDKKVKCWLDTESVKSAMKSEGIENETISSVTDIDKMINSASYYSEEQTNEKLDSLKKMIEEYVSALSRLKDVKQIKSPLIGKEFEESEVGKIVSESNDIEEKGWLSSQRARALMMRFDLYGGIVKKLGDVLSEVKKAGVSAGIGTSEVGEGAGVGEGGGGGSETGVYQSDEITLSKGDTIMKRNSVTKTLHWFVVESVESDGKVRVEYRFERAIGGGVSSYGVMSFNSARDAVSDNEQLNLKFVSLTRVDKSETISRRQIDVYAGETSSGVGNEAGGEVRIEESKDKFSKTAGLILKTSMQNTDYVDIRWNFGQNRVEVNARPNSYAQKVGWSFEIDSLFDTSTMKGKFNDEDLRLIEGLFSATDFDKLGEAVINLGKARGKNSDKTTMISVGSRDAYLSDFDKEELIEIMSPEEEISEMSEKSVVDMAVTKLESDGEIVGGEPYKMMITLKNVGNVYINSFYIGLYKYVDGEKKLIWAMNDKKGLGAGAEFTQKVNVMSTLESGKNYHLQAEVRIKDAGVSDDNLENNFIDKVFDVQ